MLKKSAVLSSNLNSNRVKKNQNDLIPSIFKKEGFENICRAQHGKKRRKGTDKFYLPGYIILSL
jgi:hypothetical protein